MKPTLLLLAVFTLIGCSTRKPLAPKPPPPPVCILLGGEVECGEIEDLLKRIGEYIPPSERTESCEQEEPECFPRLTRQI